MFEEDTSKWLVWGVKCEDGTGKLAGIEFGDP
jgi:hypothetical protein